MIYLALALLCMLAFAALMVARSWTPECPWGCTTGAVRMECHTHTPDEATRIAWYAQQARVHIPA